MTLADRLAELNPPPKAPRVLVFDIETSPHLAWTFSTWNTNISPDMIVKPSRMLCWAAKWTDSRRVMFRSEYHDGREVMVRELRDLLDEADAVVGYNSGTFDERHVMREIMLAKLDPPSPFQTIDLLRTIRSTFKFPSNRLGQVGTTLGIGAKIDTGGWPLWQKVLDCDAAAWEKFKRYNVQDCRLTADLLESLVGFLPTLPHHGLWSGDMSTCYACGGADLMPTGWIHTRSRLYPKVQCRECGSWSKVMKDGTTRPV